MIRHKSANAWVIGLALFSMFFGAGNLIFSITVGKHAEHMFAYGAVGFIITAVLLPFLGVVTMVLFNGDYMKFFGIFGRYLGFIFAFMLLSFWIPLGSGPRCITLAYAATATYIENIPLWVFSAIYSGVVYAMTYRENNVITILGKILTPLLLLSLLAVVIVGFLFSPGLGTVDHPPMQVFIFGLEEGYNTQDLIASFFFSSAIIHILRQNSRSDAKEGDNKGHLGLVLRSGIIGISILCLVYFGLLYMGAVYAPELRETGKESLLAQLSLYLLGTHAAFVPVSAIVLACISTSVALMLVFTTFLKETVCRNQVSHTKALIITVGVTFLFSLLGFEGISLVLSIAMRLFYPLLIGLIVINLLLIAVRHRRVHA